MKKTYLKPTFKHYRVVHSRFPPINIFDDEDEKDNLLLAELEGETSDRLTNWSARVRSEDFRCGDGWGSVMAAFCYGLAGRFNTDDFGAYYAADNPHTALKEWSYHRAHTWQEFGFTDEADATVRCYTGTVKKELVDVRKNNRVHAKNDYNHSQKLAQGLVNDKEYGLIYRSVRDKGGICIALFRPPATSPVKQAAHYCVRWDGENFVEYAKMGEYRVL